MAGFAVVTVSDGVSAGTRTDEAGPAAVEFLLSLGLDENGVHVVPDDSRRLAELLTTLAAEEGIALIVTTGGTGLGPRDITPEATRTVIDREAPGIGELIRSNGLAHTPMAALSRGIAGLAGSTLIVNLPGSTKAVREGLEALREVLPHALDLTAGNTEHAPTS
jgi:molybdenum cofactor synthesis domain-containing protein